MSAITIPVLVLVLLAGSFLLPASSSVPLWHNDPTTAYRVLTSYNFPQGLLPKCVLGYRLDVVSGEFAVKMNRTCNFKLDGSYELRYVPRIEGLKGVSVKDGGRVVWNRGGCSEGDGLEFSVGVASKGFPVENFRVCPDCGLRADTL